MDTWDDVTKAYTAKDLAILLPTPWYKEPTSLVALSLGMGIGFYVGLHIFSNF